MADITGMLQAAAGGAEQEGWNLGNTSLIYVPFNNRVGNTYPGKTFSVTSQATAPTGVAVSGSGTKMWVLNNDGNLYQYTLSTPFEVSTASYDSVSNNALDFVSAGLYDIKTYPDGQTFWFLDITYDRLLEYETSVDWDLSTLDFVSGEADPEGVGGMNKSFSVSAQDTVPTAVVISTDGTKAFITGDTNDIIVQYNLSTPFDITTASATTPTFTVGPVISPYGLFISDDGLNGYVASLTLDIVYQLEFGTAFTLSTADYVSQPYDTDGIVYLNKSYLVSGQTTFPGSVAFKSDGTKMYVLTAGTVLYQYSLSTAWDVTTATYDSVTKNLSSFNITSAASFYFKSDGTEIYLLTAALDVVAQFELATAWDLSSAIVNNGVGTVATSQYASISYSVASQGTEPVAVRFKTDGTVMYVLNSSNNTIFQYTLSTPWNVSSASYATKSFSVANEELTPTAMAFKPDGTKLYVVGTTGDDVNEYDLSTAWDVDTASYVQNFSVSGQETVPTGIDFKDDGTAMYICGSTGDDVNEYSLSTPWDVSTASYVRVFSVAGQSTVPRNVEFADSGKTMVLMDNTGDRFLQYRLSTAWNISTAVFQGASSVATQETVPLGVALGDGGKIAYAFGNNDIIYQYSVVKNFSVLAQETNPTGIDFKTDGTKMYICGTTGDDVNEYDLSVAWDVNTASYTQNFSVATQTDTPRAVQFSSDGSTMSVLGRLPATTTSMRIAKYNLATPWDVSTAVFSNILLYEVYAQDTSMLGFAFGDSGKFTYLVGNAGDRVYQYQNVKSKSVNAEETNLRGVTFKPDGTKMYICGTTGDDVNEYNLSVAWDVSTASYVQNFSVASQTTAPTALQFNSSGTIMTVLGLTSTSVYTPIKYTLSTPWDISSASYIGYLTPNITAFGETVPVGLCYGDSGRFMYVTGGGTDSIHQYAVIKTYYVGAQELNPISFWFKPDGTKLFVCGLSGDDVNEYDLSTPWDISTISFVRASTQVTIGNTTSLTFNADGSVMSVFGETSDVFSYYSLATPWNVSSLTNLVQTESMSTAGNVAYGSFVTSDGKNFYFTNFTSDLIEQWPAAEAFWVGGQDLNPVDIQFKTDGTKMYVLGNTGDDVNEYDLATPWDVTTATYLRVFSVASQETNPFGLFFKPDGTKMYICGTTGDDVNEYNLSTAWNISTASFVQLKSVATEDTAPVALFFKPDGTKMYVLGNTGDDVNEYDLSTPWDVSTASYVQNFSVAAQETVPYGLTFELNGNKFYIIGHTNDTVYEYSMTTPWDISTASYTSNSWLVPDATPYGLTFKPDGTKLFVVGAGNDKVYAYQVGS
jgi:DNA-binding beta-propeller fold protein YncE